MRISGKFSGVRLLMVAIPARSALTYLSQRCAVGAATTAYFKIDRCYFSIGSASVSKVLGDCLIKLNVVKSSLKKLFFEKEAGDSGQKRLVESGSPGDIRSQSRSVNQEAETGSARFSQMRFARRLHARAVPVGSGLLQISCAKVMQVRSSEPASP
jgi:hypothetical protein